MKRLSVMMLLLAFPAVAGAALIISVDGVLDPPDTEVSLAPGRDAAIDIWGDGKSKLYMYLLGISIDSTGPAHLDIDNAHILYPGSEAMIALFDDADIAPEFGFRNPFVYMELTDISLSSPPLEGTLVDNIVFTCNGLGDVILTLIDGDAEVMDTQLIHQVPEPMTFALLALGGLFLRRRK